MYRCRALCCGVHARTADGIGPCGRSVHTVGFSTDSHGRAGRHSGSCLTRAGESAASSPDLSSGRALSRSNPGTVSASGLRAMQTGAASPPVSITDSKPNPRPVSGQERAGSEKRAGSETSVWGRSSDSGVNGIPVIRSAMTSRTGRCPAAFSPGTGIWSPSR